MDFEELSDNTQSFGDDVEAILMCCPSPTIQLYHQIVRGASKRNFPLQLHVFYAAGLESVEDAVQLYL
jgi:hypothetical protein